MRRWFPLLWVSLALGGCINTPNTKALITPIGAAGYHTFRPEAPAGRIEPSDVDELAAATAASRSDDRSTR